MLLEADLPDDVDALRALVLEQARTLADLTDAKSKADARIERLQAILEAFQRHRFGRKPEQLDPDQFELALEDIETALGSVHAASDAAVSKARGERPRKSNRGSLPAHLERIEQVVDVEDKACPCCGGALHQIGEDVAERLDVVPTTFRVLITRRPRYGCRSCENAVVKAPAPARIVEGGIPTEALVAQVLVSKYADHLPLYRQAQIYARQGIQLDRSTLADWVGRAAWYLRPLRDHILERLRRSDRLFADETTAPVLEPGRKKTKTGQIWAYTCPAGKRLRQRQKVYREERPFVDENGMLRYRASKLDCDACALRPRCCPTQPARKILRSVHEGTRDLARDIATTDAYLVSRRQRKKVEMLFAHLKRILRMDRLRLRGPNGARDEFLLAATAQNLRKIAKLIPMPATPAPA